ncbi:hypothetical protein GCM10009533_00900 [Saccharopolyspora spinosporotrichia]|uniref:Uncharacterized protein n=1 Tax=Saccharopolyspora erythraea TaxID=1836 RepID=A0ABP3LVY2_SACER
MRAAGHRPTRPAPRADPLEGPRSRHPAPPDPLPPLSVRGPGSGRTPVLGREDVIDLSLVEPHDLGLSGLEIHSRIVFDPSLPELLRGDVRSG